MAKKSFKNDTPLSLMDEEVDNPSVTEGDSSNTEYVSSSTEEEPVSAENEDSQEKSKHGTGKPVGRPKVKEGPHKTINVAVPVSMLEQMEVAKVAYGNNLTAYVNAVIRADLSANFEKYLSVQEAINSFNNM